MSFGICRLPPLLGSGKFGTPCARIHAAASIALDRPTVPVGLPALVDDPQAAIAAVARTPTTRKLKLTRDLRIVLMATLYASGGDNGVRL